MGMAIRYIQWDQTDNITKSFGLSPENVKKYNIVKGKFDDHFIKKTEHLFTKEHNSISMYRKRVKQQIIS